jgi:tetratricopeptide (TPR) repeat protein
MPRFHLFHGLALLSAIAFGCGDDDASTSPDEAPDAHSVDAAAAADDEASTTPDAAMATDAAAAPEAPSPLELAELFESVWGEPDASVRASILERILTPDGKLIGDTVTDVGLDAVKARVDGFDRVAYEGCALVDGPTVPTATHVVSSTPRSIAVTIVHLLCRVTDGLAEVRRAGNSSNARDRKPLRTGRDPIALIAALVRVLDIAGNHDPCVPPRFVDREARRRKHRVGERADRHSDHVGRVSQPVVYRRATDQRPSRSATRPGSTSVGFASYVGRVRHLAISLVLLVAFLFVLVAGCRRAETPTGEVRPAPAAQAAADPPPLANGLRFIEDDYARARAEAVRRGVPLFVDVWASWCHSCMSLKQFVLPDPALAPLAKAFVWLAIDSERASNRAFLERFATRSLPTLWVIDPVSEEPRLKWIGGATSQELASVLADARKLDASSTGASGEIAEADTLRLRGDRASAAGRAEEAVDHYRRAIAVAPADWSQRPRVLEALAMRLAELERHADNLELAVEETPRMPPGTSRLNVLLLGIDAASELPESDPARAAAIPVLIPLAERIVVNAGEPVLLDDRSSLYASLVSLLEMREPDRARKLASEWSALLEAQATREATAAARRVWDAHRVDAYLALGEPARAIPMLEQSEREVPQDFNPPARLARVHLKLAQLPAARAAIDRALPRCDGPRKLRLFLLKADILVAAGDRPAARAALEEALAFARGANLPAQYERLRQTVERRAREL